MANVRKRRVNESAQKSESSKDITKGTPEFKDIQPCLQAIAYILIGFVFGFAFEKGRVFEPETIRKQMVFEKFIMLKMVVSAVATSMVVFSVLSAAAHAQAYRVRVYGLMTKTHLAAGLGGFILGCGMTLAGACPGTVFAQVGAGVPTSLYTLAGALTGGFLYAIVETRLPEFLVRKDPVLQKRLDEYIMVDWPYMTIAFPLAAAMGGFLFVLETYVPWASEVSQSGSDLISFKSWPPFCSGILIGMLDMLVSLGTSKSVMTFVAQSCRIACPSPTLEGFKSGIINCYQVFLGAGIAAGAYVSAVASGTHGTVAGVPPGFAFGGGLVLLFGARLAGGCTSGHGVALLMTHSMLATAAMLAGGMATAAGLVYGMGVDL